MGQERMVAADGEWDDISGIWVRVHALEDPLLGDKAVRVVVHRTDRGEVFVRATGACAGVDWQTVRPDLYDFATTTGEPL